MTVVWTILKAVPVWVWVVAAALAWGGVQRVSAKRAADKLAQAQQQAAADENAELRKRMAEAERLAAVQKENARVANAQAKLNAQAAASARAAAERLQHNAVAVAASSSAGASTPAGGSPADRLAHVLGQCSNEVAALAEAADRAITRGQSCERAYDALSLAETDPGARP